MGHQCRRSLPIDGPHNDARTTSNRVKNPVDDGIYQCLTVATIADLRPTCDFDLAGCGDGWHLDALAVIR